MRDKFLTFGAPDIQQGEIDEVLAVLRSGWLGTGPRVAAFEAAFAAYKGVAPDQVVAVSSCTAALHLSLIAAGVGPGDEVIVPAMTFCATVNAVIHSGARPVLCDVDAETMNITPALAACHVTERTRAIVLVHFAGLACDMVGFTALAGRHGLALIEDSAHAIETRSQAGKAGTIGDFGCFSFYVTKNVTCGEGGMVIARDPACAARVRKLALHGMSKDAWKRYSSAGYSHYRVEEPGFKYNLTDLNAAIGLHQLSRVDDAWERRRCLWRHYDEALQGLPVILPPAAQADERHAFHLYPLRLSGAPISRDAFLAGLHGLGIGAGVHYEAISEHPCYQRAFGWFPDGFPVATGIGRQTVSLPLTAGMSDADGRDVIDATRSLLQPGV